MPTNFPSCNDCKHLVVMSNETTENKCCDRHMQHLREYRDDEQRVRYIVRGSISEYAPYRCVNQRKDSKGFFGFFRDKKRCGLQGKYFVRTDNKDYKR